MTYKERAIEALENERDEALKFVDSNAPKSQLSLITLTVTPDDARKIQMALAARECHLSGIKSASLAKDYRDLRRKVATQAQL
jgi:hypothetical protein